MSSSQHTKRFTLVIGRTKISHTKRVEQLIESFGEVQRAPYLSQLSLGASVLLWEVVVYVLIFFIAIVYYIGRANKSSEIEIHYDLNEWQDTYAFKTIETSFPTWKRQSAI